MGKERDRYRKPKHFVNVLVNHRCSEGRSRSNSGSEAACFGRVANLGAQ